MPPTSEPIFIPERRLFEPPEPWQRVLLDEISVLSQKADEALARCSRLEEKEGQAWRIILTYIVPVATLIVAIIALRK